MGGAERRKEEEAEYEKRRRRQKMTERFQKQEKGQSDPLPPSSLGRGGSTDQIMTLLVGHCGCEPPPTSARMLDRNNISTIPIPPPPLPSAAASTATRQHRVRVVMFGADVWQSREASYSRLWRNRRATELQTELRRRLLWSRLQLCWPLVSVIVGLQCASVREGLKDGAGGGLYLDGMFLCTDQR